ncbi:hypothetical protein TSAR_006479 [Trichomalopsis sarcophagae]|uniref:Protein krueppel n=1 Tax=Trichomalopsis sarcophagae TaxID=543379 RepID=A0A232FLE6_9HYME|nr:hypothetical protein TSAR_006479 [Trichomalopsis sarcophagae]
MSNNSFLSMDFEECDSSIIDGTNAAADQSPALDEKNKHNNERSEVDSDTQEGDMEIASGAVPSTRNTNVREVIKMKKINLSDNEDHNYTDTQTEKSDNSNTGFTSNFIYSKVENSGKEKYIGLKISNLNDLKKAIPRLKLPTILSSTSLSPSSSVKKPTAVPIEVKQKLHKYCRACAGLKVPLINIFSVKGKQMRLAQQIQHLEDINEHDSLSTQMCMDCICDLRMSYKFFMQIKKAEIKLKSICDSFNNFPKTSEDDEMTDVFIKKETSMESSNYEVLDNEGIKSEAEDIDCTEMNEISSIGNDSFEEFDPDNPNYTDEVDSKKITESYIELDESTGSNINTDKSSKSETYSNNVMESETDLDKESETIIQDDIDKHNDSVYQYDESLDAYIKVEHSEGAQEDVEPENKLVESNTINASQTSESFIPLTKSSNTSKRKLSSGNISDDSNDKPNKIDFQKLKDLKIPKLDLQNSTKIKTQEDGVMYVTAKGSKPNEVLLIKVKKMNKPSEKKVEKTLGKKKGDAILHQKGYSRYEYANKKDNSIDEQIEQYKKKRVQILGEVANMTETDFDENLEAKVIGGEVSTEIEMEEQEDEMENTEEYVDNIEFSETPAFPSQHEAPLTKIQQRWKDIKKRHETIHKDLAEDCTDRLKSLLRQKDEDIQEFISYLKQRRIVVSRLKDEHIISLYEAKNHVLLEKLPLQFFATPEVDIDPFEFKEIFDCDFCNESFPSRDMEYEHSKIHDFKLMHYCEDCQQEFLTHKGKRSHNITCVQKLMCKYCDMILESKGKKRQHEQKHCDEQNGQLCDLCGEKFKHQGTLDQHVKSRHMQLEKIYKCPQCSKRFAFRTKLTFHLKSVHTTSRPYLCEDCGSDFKNPASLRHHRIRKHQPTNNKKECTVCHKMIPVYSMSKHMHTHKAYTIQCPHCDKMFKNTSTLKQHIRIHEDQRQYKCDMCGVGFNRRDGLRLHMKVHLKADSRGLKECSCQLCGEKFPNHSMLVIHRNRTHKDGRNYTCHICNRSMISTRSLEWHLAHIHNETMPGIVRDESSVDAETKRVSCYHCDKTFKTEMILRTHVKNTHTEKEPMKCLDCDLKFTSEVRLKHHMMIEHNRLEGTLACPHCPKRFVNQLRLKTHMISHSDERPFTCDICGFMLKTKIQLIKHKQNRHSNERPLQCRYCAWRCKQVSALVCHERTHTNERPYSCSVCKQKFKYLGDKNKHERRHESLGGSGFKRIVTGRNTNKSVKKKDSNSQEQDSEVEHEEYDAEQQEEEEYEEQVEGQVETFDETQIIKFNDNGEIINEESETSYDQMYVEDTSQDASDSSKIVIGMEEGTVYEEEVTADQIESEMITGNIINEHMLQSGTIHTIQPGTVVHLQQQDETGKIQVIPVMLSLPDLSDATAEVNLATASIMYNN